MRMCISLAALLSVAGAALAPAQELSIASIRQNHGALQNQWVDSYGGIVTFKSNLGTRLTLQDPFASEYAAIQIRDLNSVQNDSGGWLWSQVNVGDWVSFTNVRVTEWTGNTMLRFNDPARPNTSFPPSGFTILSSGNPLPLPKRVDLADVQAPAGDGAYTIDPDELDDYRKLEGMRIAVHNVRVDELDIGRFADIYALRAQDDPSGSGPSVFAADYNNYNRDSSNDYHPLVHVGAQFESVVGYFERSKSSSTGDDYYQLVTTHTGSFGLVPGDYDYNGQNDGNDVLVWQRQESPTSGELSRWADHFGEGPTAGAVATPEPATAALALAVVGWHPRLRRTRAKRASPPRSVLAGSNQPLTISPPLQWITCPVM